MLLVTRWRLRRHIRREILERRTIGANPLADGAIDSLGLEQLVLYIEQRFDVVLREEDLVAETFADLDTLARLIESKRRRRPALAARTRADADAT